jgi:hypothetical protein
MSNSEREILLQLGQLLHDLRRFDPYGLFNSGRIYQTAFRQFGEEATMMSAKVDALLSSAELNATSDEKDAAAKEKDAD